MKWCTADFETASACDIKKAGSSRYAEDPTTEILCCAYSIDGQQYVWSPETPGDHLKALAADPSVGFIAHNAAFEKDLWRGIMVPVFGFADIPNERWHDTMAVCAMKAIPLTLDTVANLLHLGARKDTEASRFTRLLSAPGKGGRLDRSPASMVRVAAYCAQDVAVTGALHARLGFLPPEERKVWLLDQTINERGIRLDQDFIRAAKLVVQRARAPLAAEFDQITGCRHGQRAYVLKWLSANGCPLLSIEKGIVKETLERRDLSPAVRRALYIHSLIGPSSPAKLDRMEATICHDGRARRLLQYHGTSPGLWSGRLFQPQNLPRGTITLGGKAPPPEMAVAAIMSADPEYVESILGPPIEAVVSSLRHALIAAPGKRFVGGDLSGIQARLLLALAGQQDKLAMMANGQDIYLDMAEAIYGQTGLTKDDMEKRQVGKNSVLGLGFQMGPQKFHARYAKQHPLGFAEHVVHTYRHSWAPRVPELWRGLWAASVRAVWSRQRSAFAGIEYRMEGEWLTCRLPSGRKIWYYHPSKHQEVAPWSTDGSEMRRSWSYISRKPGGMRSVTPFGGMLAENVVMGMQRDLITRSMLRCETEGMPVVLTVHDDILVEVDHAAANPLALQQIMCDPTEWSAALGVPVASDVWEGERYRK